MPHPIKQILEENGYKLTDAGEWWRCRAMYRNGQTASSLAIHKNTGRFTDFALNISGDAKKLMELIGGGCVDFADYVPEPERPKLRIPKTFDPSILKRHLPQYDLFLNRGISKETLQTFQAGMAHSGKLNRRIVFPVFDRSNRIIGLAGRWFKENPPENAPKWKLLSSKSSFLWPVHLNESIIRDSKEIIIAESVGDCLNLWEAGIKNFICIFGVSLSGKQLSYILSTDPERIIIATNNDIKDHQAGQRAAEKIKKTLCKHFKPEKVIIALPTSKDFGEMNTDSIKNWYAKI